MIAQANNLLSMLTPIPASTKTPLQQEAAGGDFGQVLTRLFDQLNASEESGIDLVLSRLMNAPSHEGEMQSDLQKMPAQPPEDNLPILETETDDKESLALVILIAAIQHIFQRVSEQSSLSVIQTPANPVAQGSNLAVPFSGNDSASPSGTSSLIPNQTSVPDVPFSETAPAQVSTPQTGVWIPAQAEPSHIAPRDQQAGAALMQTPVVMIEEANRPTPWGGAVANAENTVLGESGDRHVHPATELASLASEHADEPHETKGSLPTSRESESAFLGTPSGSHSPSLRETATVPPGRLTTDTANRFLSSSSTQTSGLLHGHLLPRHTVVLQLDPPELGHLHVQVHVSDERLAATFWAESDEVRALLRSHFPALNQTLSERGFHAHQISIRVASDDFTGNSGQFTHPDPGSQFHSAGKGYRNKETGGTPALSIGDASALPRPSHNGLLDLVI